MAAVQQIQRETKAEGAHTVSFEPTHESCLPSHELVAKRAFEIWKRHGCPKGTEFHDWLAAEAELRSGR